jgi:glutathione S-transferase
LINNPTFSVFAIATFVLCANLIFLWAYSGVVRGRTKTAMNHEDAAAFGAPLVDQHPPAVARVLRAHANAEACIYPFLFLALIFVLAGGTAGVAEIFFGLFTVARVAHSAFYLAEKQPWRTFMFVGGGVATVAVLGEDIWLIVRASTG